MEKKKSYTPEFKAQVVIEALKEQKTLSELAAEFDVQTSEIVEWKTHLQQEAEQLFEKEAKKNAASSQEMKFLYDKAEQLENELEWLKQKYAVLTKGKG